MWVKANDGEKLKHCDKLNGGPGHSRCSNPDILGDNPH